MTPRNTLTGTVAEQMVRRDFFATYIRKYLLDGEDEEIADAYAIFNPIGIERMRPYLSAKALSVPLVLTEYLSNRVLAIHLTLTEDRQAICLNTRFRVDPDVLVCALLEEYAHAQQVLDGVDFLAQQQQYAYADRPYEQEAKSIATQIVGYVPEGYGNLLLRDEPTGPLYDVPYRPTMGTR